MLINGTGESGATWDVQMRALSQRWRCIAIDNRDTGDSSYVEHAYAPADMARDAAGVIDALELGPTHIVGYSLGGATAQELAIARPELVRSLVLLSTWMRSDEWFVAQFRNWKAIRRAHLDDEAAFLSALAPWLFAPATFAKPGAVDAIYEHAASIETPQKPDGWMRQCEADMVHELKQPELVEAPTLVLVGADDICTPPRYSVDLANALPTAELETIPDAAHCALFEQPDLVSEAIQRFLSEV